MVAPHDPRYGGHAPVTPPANRPAPRTTTDLLPDGTAHMSDHAAHETRLAFHGQLDAMDDKFVTAGLAVAEALPRLSAGFLAGDHAVIERAEALVRNVGDACEDVEDRGFVLLARESPVAGDLRRLVALLRMTVDVSRSASLLRHACVTLKRFDPRLLAEPMRSHLEELAERSSAVFVAGMDAWRRRDALAVAEVDLMDEDVDRLQAAMLSAAAEVEEVGDELLVLGLLARYYERIADHGVEIARDAAFVATGQRVRVGKRKEQPVADQLQTDADADADAPPTGRSDDAGQAGD